MTRVLITLFFWFFTFNYAQGQGYWTDASGPFGGAFSQVLRTPSGALYLTKNLYKVYRSNDNGESWSPVNNPQLDPLIPRSWEIVIGLAGNFYKSIP